MFDLNKLSLLSVIEQKVVTLRFGLDNDNKPRTLFEVSEILGITRERVRQIQEQALRKIA